MSLRTVVVAANAKFLKVACTVFVEHCCHRAIQTLPPSAVTVIFWHVRVVEHLPSDLGANLSRRKARNSAGRSDYLSHSKLRRRLRQSWWRPAGHAGFVSVTAPLADSTPI
jgi:hypothetical protein